jgi:ATP-binding cassette subfamily B protein
VILEPLMLVSCLRQLDLITSHFVDAVSTFLINTCVQASLLLLGSIFVQQGKLTPEVLLAFMLYQGQLQEWSLNLFQSYSSLIKSSGAGDRVFFLLDRHPPPPGTGNSSVKSLETEPVEVMTKEDITIENVSFSYPGRPDSIALNKISLKIESGSLVALVGHSGCGKSTIVSLLQRLYDPNEGAIKFGDLDLRNMSLKSHREKLGVVTQDPVLFSGTIEDNIRYGSSATFDEILVVSRIANAHSFIEQFPNKYKEQVGERGQSLSGGQRQRIAIARALARKPALLLLDEATSALDPESEAAVQEALNELLQNRFGMTTIVIAHRLQTVRCADTIFVMKNGSLVEQGSHDQLLQRGSGHYRRMLDRVDSAGLLP